MEVAVVVTMIEPSFSAPSATAPHSRARVWSLPEVRWAAAETVLFGVGLLTHFAGAPRGVSWTSRLGHSYQRRPPPILEPLPDPLGRGRPPFPLLIPTDAGWEDSEIWEKPPSNGNHHRRRN
jgi:hypothetical protein